jgi:outer membrane murein-binding lipoprotein Lpp
VIAFFVFNLRTYPFYRTLSKFSSQIRKAMRNYQKLTLAIVASLFLASCSNTQLEERVSELEQKVAQLEGKASAQQPSSESVALTSLEETQATGTTTGGAAPKFEFAEMEYDFGTITEGDVVEHTFTFTNTGEAPLVIQNASASCGCTVPDWPKEPVAVGNTSEIRVRFDSSNKTGVQNKTIRITANTEPATTTLQIKSSVTPKQEATAGPVRK